jgi:GMP synthase (glutamine-hydrolysing)
MPSAGRLQRVRTLAITYEHDAGPGVFVDAFDGREASLDIWLRTETAEPPADPTSYDAVLCFGGSMHVSQEDQHPWLREDQRLLAELTGAGVPVMGLCLGAQLLTRALGGEVRKLERPEIGWFQVEPAVAAAADPLLAPLSARPFTGFGWHSFECLLPAGAVELARSDSCLQAYRHGGSAWAIQFHPEVRLEDAEAWIHDYRKDEDAVALGLDPEELRAETRRRIGGWNELGRGLCARFLEAARAPTRA